MVDLRGRRYIAWRDTTKVSTTGSDVATKPPIQKLPPEMMEMTAGYLTIKDLCSLRLVDSWTNSMLIEMFAKSVFRDIIARPGRLLDLHGLLEASPAIHAHVRSLEVRLPGVGEEKQQGASQGTCRLQDIVAKVHYLKTLRLLSCAAAEMFAWHVWHAGDLPIGCDSPGNEVESQFLPNLVTLVLGSVEAGAADVLGFLQALPCTLEYIKLMGIKVIGRQSVWLEVTERLRQKNSRSKGLARLSLQELSYLSDPVESLAGGSANAWHWTKLCFLPYDGFEERIPKLYKCDGKWQSLFAMEFHLDCSGQEAVERGLRIMEEAAQSDDDA